MAKKIVTIVILYVIMQTCLYPLRGNEWYYVMNALAYFASVYIFVQFNKKWRKATLNLENRSFIGLEWIIFLLSIWRFHAGLCL